MVYRHVQRGRMLLAQKLGLFLDSSLLCPKSQLMDLQAVVTLSHRMTSNLEI